MPKKAKAIEPAPVDYTFNKETYWDRRKHGTSGTIRAAIYHQVVHDEDGNEQRIPIAAKMGDGQSKSKYTGKHVDRRYTKPNHGKFVKKMQQLPKA